MNTIADRIRAERKRLGLSQAELAKRVSSEAGQSFISNIETGARTDTPFIPELAHALGVDAYWLKTGKGSPSSTSVVAIESDDKYIPHLSAKGSMGSGELMIDSEEVIDRITLKSEWIRSNVPGCRISDLAVISGRGNSMSPTFSDGDLLLVDTGARVVDIDGVYVLSAHERLFIKTVRQRIDGSFEISSDNPSVKTVDILNGDHQVTVHGRVVLAWNGKRL